MSTPTPDAWLQLRGVKKSFAQGRKQPSVPVLKGLDLEVRQGECLVLLGASGSGKTTTLRLLAGFEQAEAGSIHCGGRLWDAAVPPDKRGVAMVFQEAALYPHLNVLGNLEFGLGKITGETAQVLSEVVAYTGIGAWMQRRPEQLSGGEKQRVSLARALSRNRPLLLCDEPLSQLDVASRTELRRMIRDWQRRKGLTVVYVTHDQAEAMALADRLAILKDGRVLECASPEELYARPEHLATAQFLGSPGINVFETRQEEGEWRMPWGEGVAAGQANVGIRPEHWKVARAEEGFAVTVIEREYAGHETVYTLACAAPGNCELRWRTGESGYALGESLRLAVDWSRALFFQRDAGSGDPAYNKKAALQ